MKLDKFRHLRGSIRKADFTTKNNKVRQYVFQYFYLFRIKEVTNMRLDLAGFTINDYHTKVYFR